MTLTGAHIASERLAGISPGKMQIFSPSIFLRDQGIAGERKANVFTNNLMGEGMGINIEMGLSVATDFGHQVCYSRQPAWLLKQIQVCTNLDF